MNFYAPTKTISDQASFRATQRFRLKAQRAGHGPALVKRCNAEPGPLGRSLRAGGWAALRGVAPAWHRMAMPAPPRLAADRPVTR
jgi:hypothetical protein